MQLNFDKENGLIPAIIQDNKTKNVLMLGYMNKEALDRTKKEGKVTFYSRSKKRLWTKGETSGNFLTPISIKQDCDNDALLIYVTPKGNTCHTGTDTCWGEDNKSTELDVLPELEKIIESRYNDTSDQSYTSSLFKKGINKIAQKVGEEAVELVIEAKDNNKELFLNEAADLLFHYLILLKAKNYRLSNVLKILKQRRRVKN